jgi:two-component system cell cycle response regulator CtrA
MHLLLAESGYGKMPGFKLALSIASNKYLIDSVSLSDTLCARAAQSELVILGSKLDDVSGIQALAQLRHVGITTPVIFLCDSNSPQERARALRDGADDALTPPMHPHEFEARIFAVVHRPREEFLPKTLQAGPVVLDLKLKNAFLVRGSRKIKLHVTGQEFKVLQLLVQRQDTVVTREMLLDELYGGGDKEPQMKIIDVFICTLRAKLAGALNWDPIDTSWGRGYRLLKEPMPGEVVDKVA